MGCIVNWAPLTTSSLTTNIWLTRADFSASKSLTAMLKSSVATRINFNKQFLLQFFTRCKRDPAYKDSISQSIQFRKTFYGFKQSSGHN